MKPVRSTKSRRATVLLMIVGLLAMLFILVSAYITLARFDRLTLSLVRDGEDVEAVLNSVEEVVLGALRGAWSGNGDLVTRTDYANIPGYGGTTGGNPWGSRWLAQDFWVRDPNALGTLPQDYIVVATSSFGDEAGVSLPATELMYDAGAGSAQDDGRVLIYPQSGVVDPSGVPLDTRVNAIDPFMDAAGFGISNAWFPGTAQLTELANTMVDRPVRAQGIDPAHLPTMQLFHPNVMAMREYERWARYQVAARVISHGHMVQVSARSGIDWNRTFIGAMFNWLRHPDDAEAFDPYASDVAYLLDQMHASTGAVEPLLRRRGGLLASFRASAEDPSGQPYALRELQDRFKKTFNPYFDPNAKASNWQPFNLASLGEWNAFRKAMTVDAEEYNNIYYGGMGGNARKYYVPRASLTSINHSDELARNQSDLYPAPGSTRGIRPGRLKYYLGNITAAGGAFDSNGLFSRTLVGLNPSRERGQVVVQEIASYFYEMLAGYSKFPDVLGGGTAEVRRWRQAVMLAVNAVQNAAPRDLTTGYIDAVYYDDGGNRYIGYAPQPFLTQVVAYNQTDDPDDPSAPAQLTLAVELFNPHEPNFAETSRLDLDLRYFALSINMPVHFDPSYLLYLDPAGGSLQHIQQPWGIITDRKLDGRRFMTVSINDGSNTWFDQQHDGGAAQFLNGRFFVNPGYLPGQFGTDIKVQLWRWGESMQGWYLVDQMEVPTDAGWSGGGGALPTNQPWYVDMKRDTSYEPYLGGTLADPVRWRMTVAFPSDAGNTSVIEGGDPSHVLPSLGYGSDQAGLVQVTGPCVPLYMMNARGTVNIHGVARPASYPTVGFMLFLPRYTHVMSGERKPITRVLYEEWQDQAYDLSDPDGPKYPPADFGHMPVFVTEDHSGSDSHVYAWSEFHGNRQGAVPWGLLVFDYFTTLDPQLDANGDGEPDIDPYRVPGRININTAPWYTLAGLPVIAPTTTADGNLPLAASASPAFWRRQSGVLAGVGTDGTTYRYPGVAPDGESKLVYLGGANQWSRLGHALAQTAAAYRDRTRYIGGFYAPPFPLVSEAHRRSGAGVPYRPTRYGSIRGAFDDVDTPSTAGTWKRGFLTIGELANAMGFDGSVAFGYPSADPNLTTLGKYQGATQLGGDFMKAVSLMALLDTHFLTTRSNVFTVYITLKDRDNPQASVRSQITVDRSNLLPREVWYDLDGDGVRDPQHDPLLPDDDRYGVLQNTGLPEVIGQRQVSYFNARYDE